MRQVASLCRGNSMKKIYSIILYFVCSSSYAYDIPMQGPIQVMPTVKDMARAYGLSEDMISKMPGDLPSHAKQGSITEETLRPFKGFTDDLCKQFKGAEISFNLGLNPQGELSIMPNTMGQGLTIKVKCP